MKTMTAEKETPNSKLQTPEKDQAPSTKDQSGEAGGNGEMEVKWVLRKEIRPDPEQPRKVFDLEKLEELAESIRAVGIRQPLQVERHAGFEVRPDKDVVNPGWEIVERGTGRVAQVELHEKNARKAAQALGGEKPFYKLVDGERRWRAAELAGMERVPVLVVDGLSEKERLAVQVVLNQQHENLSALEEAGAYAREIASGRHTAETLYKALGISRGKLFGRLALNRLSGPVREALVSGRISVSVAGLVAMVPGEAKQKECLGHVIQRGYGGGDRVMSVREVQEMIDREYIRQLKDAPFEVGKVYPVDKKGKMVAAGKDGKVGVLCAGCQFRSGNMAAEFPELAKRPNVCTNLECYEAKWEASVAERVAEAKGKGRQVLEGKAAAALFQEYGNYDVRNDSGWVDLSRRCEPLGWDYKNHWKAALKDKCPEVTLAVAPNGELRELVKAEAAAAGLKAAGHKVERRESYSYSGISAADRAKENARRKKEKGMLATAWRVMPTFLDKLAGLALDGKLWPLMAERAFRFTSIEEHAVVAKGLGLTKVQTDCREKLVKWLKENKGDAVQCARMTVMLLVGSTAVERGQWTGGPKWDKEFVALCEAAKVSLEEAGDKTPNSKLQHPEKQQSPSTKKTAKAKTARGGGRGRAGGKGKK